MGVFVYNGSEPLTKQILEAYVVPWLQHSDELNQQKPLVICRTHCDLDVADITQDQALIAECIQLHGKQPVVRISLVVYLFL